MMRARFWLLMHDARPSFFGDAFLVTHWVAHLHMLAGLVPPQGGGGYEAFSEHAMRFSHAPRIGPACRQHGAVDGRIVFDRVP
jgi:hypothetical protein